MIQKATSIIFSLEKVVVHFDLVGILKKIELLNLGNINYNIKCIFYSKADYYFIIFL